MNTTHNTKTQRLIAALGVAAAAAVAPALLFAGAGTAHAAPCSGYGVAAYCFPFPTVPDRDLGVTARFQHRTQVVLVGVLVGNFLRYSGRDLSGWRAEQ